MIYLISLIHLFYLTVTYDIIYVIRGLLVYYLSVAQRKCLFVKVLNEATGTCFLTHKMFITSVVYSYLPLPSVAEDLLLARYFVLSIGKTFCRF